MLRGLGWVVIVWYYPHFIPINFGSQYRYRAALIVNKALGLIIILTSTTETYNVKGELGLFGHPIFYNYKIWSF